MDVRDRQRLQMNTSLLVSDLTPSDVMPALLQDNVLTFDDAERINNQKTTRDSALKLLEILLKKGDTAYKSFRNALQESHAHLGDLLDRTQLRDMVTNDTNDIGFLIGSELADHYQRSLQSISPLQWCNWFQLDFESVFTQVQLVRGDRRKAYTRVVQKTKYNYTSQLQDLFNPHQDCASPNRIMLQGEPGIGKSTLCQKIAFDWSKHASGAASEENIQLGPKYLQRFKLLFYLHARDMGESLWDSIYDHILPEDFTVNKEDFQTYVEQHQKEILFIVDGYDEISKKATPLVQKLVQRRIVPHSTVLLTSRSQYALHLIKHFDSLFNVNGYSESRMEEFVQKYSTDMGIPVETFSALLKRISVFSSVKEICRNPLNLCFLCILCEEREGKLPNTRTEIYDEIVDMLLQKAGGRLGMETEELEEHLKRLCEVAFHGLQQGLYTFPETLFSCEKVLKTMGFLNKELPMSKLPSCMPYYVFTHKSFQEYLGARHVSSLPESERRVVLEQHLRSRTMYSMWSFYCGINRKNEPQLLDYFTEMQKQFCPLSVDTVPGQTPGWLHLPRRIPFNRLSIQDIKAGPHIQCLKSIKELELNQLSNKTLKVVAESVPQQITLSHLLLSKRALTGLLNFLKEGKSGKKYDLIISAEAFFEDDQTETVLSLLKEIANTGRIESVGLHMITCASQLKVAFNTFDLHKEFSPIKKLKLHCMNYISACEEDVEFVGINPALESVEVYDCTNSDLLAKLVRLTGTKCSLTKLVVKCCTLDEEVLAVLTTTVKSAVNLSHIEFTNNQVQAQKEVLILQPFLVTLKARGPCLKFVAISNLPSRQAWQADPTSCKYATECLKNILGESDLDHLHLSKTVFDDRLVHVLSAFVQKSNLKSIEIESCFIICIESFNVLLTILKSLPHLQHFSVNRSTFRTLDDTKVLDPQCSFLEEPESNDLHVRLSPEIAPRSPRSPRTRKLFSNRNSPPPKFSFRRATSVPDDLYQKVVLSTANNARSDERSSSIHIIHTLLERTQSLTRLVISDLHTDQLVCLCKGLEANKTLLSVALPYSNLTKGCTSALCGFLEKHPCLQEFSMTRSNMNSIEMEPFFSSVAKCRTLQTLGLGNFFHDRHMPFLAAALNKSWSICNVFLRNNSRVTAEGAKVLYNTLKENSRQIRILDMSDCKITRDEEIVEKLKDVVLLVKVNWF